jgi:hypothetical protein
MRTINTFDEDLISKLLHKYGSQEMCSTISCAGEKKSRVNFHKHKKRLLTREGDKNLFEQIRKNCRLVLTSQQHHEKKQH